MKFSFYIDVNIVHEYNVRKDAYLGNDKKIAWHPGFVNAMKLELAYNEDELVYDTERELNQQPLRIDFLVIKKNETTIIKNKIGRFFLGHNLIEYKSEDDQMNIDTLFKILAYGCLYKAYAKEIDEISEHDITLTLVRRRKPTKLFSYFEMRGITLNNPESGIYIISDYFQFPIQFIVMRELNEDEHIWLTALTGELSKEHLQKLLSAVQKLQKKNEKIYSDAVVSVVTRANYQQIKKIKEEDAVMYGELLRLLKPDLDQEIDEAVKLTTHNVTQSVTRDVTQNMILRMLKMEKYGYEEIADIAGVSVETVKKIENSLTAMSK